MNENPYKSPQIAAEPAGLRGMDPFDRPTWVRWQMMVILMGFTCLNHFHRQSLPSVVNFIMRDCGLTTIQMGWIFTSFLLGYVLFMSPGGWLADWLGGKRTLVVSGLGTAALVAATGLCGY
ncbi:MAG: MFS transporter, partial [Planctomycetales bacterium]|nr:MFS transporter [Planctomycetales bacterium]